MDRTRACVVGGLTALVLAGCSGVGTRVSSLDKKLPEQAATIVVGESDRASVRALLGQPWLTSNHWRFDLFRSTDWEATFLVLAFIPVPFATNDVRGYVLVSYGEDDKAIATGWSLARGGATFGEGGLGRRSAAVDADGLAYWESDNGDSYAVAVDATRAAGQRDPAVAAGQCRLLIATVSIIGGLRVAIDGERPWTLPPDSQGFPPSLLPLDVPPGRHELRFTSDAPTFAYDAVSKLSCAAGESAYVKVTLTRLTDQSRSQFWQEKWEYSAEVTVARDRPDWAGNYGLIIYANGRWLVPQEPGR